MNRTLLAGLVLLGLIPVLAYTISGASMAWFSIPSVIIIAGSVYLMFVGVGNDSAQES